MFDNLAEDIKLVKELRSYTDIELAEKYELSRMTVSRWMNGSVTASDTGVERFYAAVFNDGIRLNKIKSQLYTEENSASGTKILFHGSKAGIIGAISLQYSGAENDFGPGFYCGESLEQSAMFIARHRRSSVYVISFKTTGLKKTEYGVDIDWMLSIAMHRGHLSQYSDHPIIRKLKAKTAKADYIVAPVADNRMFELIDEFSSGLITDQQCSHALSATNLGMQYVIISDKALRQLDIIEQLYLPQPERDYYLNSRKESQLISEDKVKAARRSYRAKGKFIDDILK